MDILGMAAVVTGGASGLGLGTAKRLAAAGAKVTLLDVNLELGMAAAAEIGGHFVNTDITDESAVKAALGEAEGVNGKARILVNCAGIGPPAKVVDRDGHALRLPTSAGSSRSTCSARSMSCPSSRHGCTTPSRSARSAG